MGFRRKSNGQNGENLAMTRSRLVGRGGARPGAGRPRKPVADPTAIAGAQAKPERTPIIPTGLGEDDLKKFCEALAFETLATIAAEGASESARVAASRELLDRAQGKPKAAPAPAQKQESFFDEWDGLLDPRQSPSAATN
jgi:hypothetical protein